MTNGLYWLYWVVAFLGVVAVLMVAVAVQEWIIWRGQNRPPPA